MIDKSKRRTVNKLLKEGKTHQQISRAIKESVETVNAYVANLTRNKEGRAIRKGGLLILECTSEAIEGKSEGAFLQELAKVLNPTINVQVEPVNDAREFLDKLEKSNKSTIHISAHGRDFVSKRNLAGVKGTIIGFPAGDFVTSIQIKQKLLEKKEKERPKLMIMSACECGSNEMVRAIKEGGCRYFIAPLEKTYWFDAAVFITLFYRLLFIEGSTPWTSFKRTDKALRGLLHKYSGYWNFYDDGRLCWSSDGQKLNFVV